MRKRGTRPARFVQVDNNAVDKIQSITAKGLLVTMLRAQDGDDITVAGLVDTHDEGRIVLEKAMRHLVEDGYVVKFKIQSQASDGTHRGGSWRTEVMVDTAPFERDYVADQLAEIFAEGNVRAVRVEPARLDPRADTAEPPTVRPTRRNRLVGPTRENEVDEEEPAGGTDKSVSDGRTADRRTRGGSNRNKTVVEDSLSGRTSHTADGQEERETDTRQDNTAPADVLSLRLPEPAPPSEAATALVAALPGRLGRATVTHLAPLVDAAFACGFTPETLRAELTDRVDVSRIHLRNALPGLYERVLNDLPDAPPVASTDPEPCPDHPARRRGRCVECALAVPA
ncbi:hypothetical protein [Streptomyces sp. NPDC101115]|uniref:hypothetical protein n=1 Tax=Streptomyces sp. NPDC101115 TaxID=3366106 RepID=UPI00380CD6C8